MYTLAEENYLKAIYTLQDLHPNGVSTNAIADRLQTKAASVSDMLKKLAQKQLVEYEKYKGAQLTSSGSEIAIRILRKHRLWEVFLVEKLDFGWEEVHELAEQLEHIQSPKLTDRLDAFLGFPKYDPHGDPIPNKEGVFPVQFDMTLSECQTGDRVSITGVKDSSTEFLMFLERSDMRLGSQLSIVNHEPFDHSVQFEQKDGSTRTISAKVARNLYVKLL